MAVKSTASRKDAYSFFVETLKGYTILDLDLNSCCTSVVLGLFPGELNNIRKALAGKNLCKELEFKKAKKTFTTNRPLCV
jgi:hypothetical protein